MNICSKIAINKAEKWLIILVSYSLFNIALAADIVPTEIELPGTQPNEISNLESPDKCDNCHAVITPQTPRQNQLPVGNYHDTFHFAMNNHVARDNRIPPYGMSYDIAKKRNALPVPATQYGDPGEGVLMIISTILR